MPEDEAKKIFAENLNRLMQINNKKQGDLSNDLQIKQTTLSDWINAKKFPRIDKIELLANYFHVKKSDLIEKYNPAELTLSAKDERNIQKKLEDILEGLSSNSGMAYYNDEAPMDESDRELLRISLENTLRMARQMAKQKFTPKKYRKE